QAEDGIRDLTVTGVQTCALPILPDEWVTLFRSLAGGGDALEGVFGNGRTSTGRGPPARRRGHVRPRPPTSHSQAHCGAPTTRAKIGRASCRERVYRRVDRWRCKK